jgi:hypothetical protein
MTLTMLAILTTLVVAFLSVSRSDRSVAFALRGAQSTRLVAQGAIAHAVDLLRSNIPTPTHLGVKTKDLTPNTFTVNPGLLRVINGAGVTAVDLHTGAVPATPPPDLTYPEDLNIVSYDLNAPVPGENIPAIVWPVDAGGNPVAANADGSPSAAAPVMRVGWHNVVADPTLPAGATNPIVSRYAFWIDDESGRLNYNIASGKPDVGNNVTTPAEIATNGAKYWEEIEFGHPVPHFQLGRTPKSAMARGGAGNAIDDESDFNSRYISLGHPRSINIDPILQEWTYAGNQNAVNLLKATAFQHYYNHGSQLYPEGILNYMTEARYAAAGGSYDRQVHPDDILWYQKNKWNITANSKAPEFDAFGRARHYLSISAEGREGGGNYHGPFVYNDKSPAPNNATDRVPYVNLAAAGANVKWTRINLESVDRIYRYLRNTWPKGGGGTYVSGGIVADRRTQYQTALNAWWFAHCAGDSDPSPNQKRGMALVNHRGGQGGYNWDWPLTAMWYYDDAADEGTHWKPLNTDRINNQIRYKGKLMMPHDSGPYITEVQFEVEPELVGTTHVRYKFRWKAEYYFSPYEQTWNQNRWNDLNELPVNVDVLNIFGRRGPVSPWTSITPHWGHRAGNVADRSAVLGDWESGGDPAKKRTLGIPVHTRLTGDTGWHSQWDIGNWNSGNNSKLAVRAPWWGGPTGTRNWASLGYPSSSIDGGWNFQVATSDWFYITKIADDWNFTDDLSRWGTNHWKHRDGIRDASTNSANAQLFPYGFYGPWDHDTDPLTPDETTIRDFAVNYSDLDPTYSPAKLSNNELQLQFQFRFGLAGSGYALSMTPMQALRNWGHYPTWTRPSVFSAVPAGQNLPADQDLLAADINLVPAAGPVTFGWENTTDPRLYGNSQNWRVTSATHIDPRFQGTMGAPNLDDWREWGNSATPADFWLWGGQDTSKLRFVLPDTGDDVGQGWRIPWPAGLGSGYPWVDRNRGNGHDMRSRMPSAGQLSLIPSGLVNNVPWQSLNYGGKGTVSTIGGLPDWLLSEIFTPSYLYQTDQYADDASGPDEFNTVSHMHSTAGKVNINTEIFPKSVWFDAPERQRPLEGVFYNLRDRSDPDEADAFVTSILDAQSATNYFLYPGELAGVTNYAKGRSEWNKETVLRNMYSCLTTNSNTFGVWGVAQTVQKVLGNLDGVNDGVFEKGDQVTGERRFYALVERSIYPGKDGVPGNAHVDSVTGVFDRIASPQFNADYDIDGDGDKENRSVMTDLPGSHPMYTGHKGNGPGEECEAWWPEIDGPSAVAGVVGMATQDIQWGYIGNQTDTYHGRFGGVAVSTGAAATFEEAYNPVEPVYKYEVKFFRFIDE